MLILNENLLIAKGGTRNCYHHPTRNDQCVKVTHTGGIRMYLRTLREIYYTKKYKTKKFEVAPYYYGKTKTNLGTGYIFGKVKDWNGKTSITLLNFVKYNNEDKILAMISQMYNSFLKNRALVHDLHPGNIVVYYKDLKTDPYLVLIDGIGNNDFIKICDYSKFFHKKKLNRKFDRLIQKLNIQDQRFK